MGESVSSKFISFVKGYKYSILFFIPLLILSYILNNKILFAVINIASLFFLFNTLAKTRYTFVISYFLSIIITSNIVYYLLYSSSMYLGIFSSIFETTPIESREMFGELYLYIIPVLAIVLFLTFKMLKELKVSSLKRKYSTTAFFGILFIFIPIYLFVNISRDKDSLRQALFKDNPVSWAQTVLSSKFPIVYNDIAVATIYFKERQRIKQLLLLTKETPAGIIPDTTRHSVDRIYLVIGETSFRGHYSLYGYNVPTTPFLDSLKNNTKNLFFYDAISSACITRDAVRMALSFATPLDLDAFFTKKNIIDLAKEQGYETLWISNQERVDSYDNYTGMLASSSDEVFFETQHGIYRNDLGLIKRLEEFSDPSKKQLVVLHLQGSHLPYEYRADSIDIDAIPLHTTGNITNYDRTIHYTDRVLREIYKYSLKHDEQSLIYYFSDHGEIIGQGHGLMHGGKAQFEIPLIVMDNNSGIAVNEIIDKYIDPQLGVVNSVNTIYILSELLGYKLSENVIDKALVDSKYVYHIDGKYHLYKDINEN